MTILATTMGVEQDRSRLAVKARLWDCMPGRVEFFAALSGCSNIWSRVGQMGQAVGR